MEAFSLSSSISIASSSVVKVSNYKHGRLSSQNKSSMVCCQSGNNAIKFSGISSVLTETSPLISPDHGPALMEAESLVLSSNGKDLASPGGQSTSVAEMLDEGIGIVKFLRGKTFLITGATGFLGKGVVFF